METWTPQISVPLQLYGDLVMWNKNYSVYLQTSEPFLKAFKHVKLERSTKETSNATHRSEWVVAAQLNVPAGSEIDVTEGSSCGRVLPQQAEAQSSELSAF